jgi:hypothetical protein
MDCVFEGEGRQEEEEIGNLALWEDLPVAFKGLEGLILGTWPVGWTGLRVVIRVRDRGEMKSVCSVV